VIIGGWAHRLYRLHPYAQAVEYAPLTTLDTDVALPTGLRATTVDIRQGLLAQGFSEEFLGDDRPPATHYRLRDEASGFYAEFLTPLLGSSHDRANTRRAGNSARSRLSAGSGRPGSPLGAAAAAKIGRPPRPNGPSNA